jgi:intein/homing endonuclease
MKGIVITVKNSSEFKFLSELLKKLGISSTIESVEEMEDIGLYKLMKSADRNKKVSREKIMSKLKS